ncbi:MAG TPA: sigma-70 family RNA polymerase sigma factor [Solirubrobacterales bacterium]|nr:sigma-70 family RNA polymerase sigma factor [Solirubrobacterales bacterium]
MTDLAEPQASPARTSTPAPTDADFEAYRVELTGYAYRMLGSAFEAEDAVQETFVRAWRALDRFEGRSSLRSWLYRIATNVCLDMLGSRERRARPMDLGPALTADHPLGAPLMESMWVEPAPDARILPTDGDPAEISALRESVRLAFVAALQHLPPRQRAVLILREVLGFSAREVAEALETTVASVNSALQRARETVEERLPEESQQATLRSLGDDRVRTVVEAYVEAWERGDIDALRALLTADAVFSMPPWSSWWRGRETLARFANDAVGVCSEALSVPTHANGQPAIAYYSLDAESGRYTATAIDVLTLEGPRIKEITAFVGDRAFPYFGLPREYGAR